MINHHAWRTVLSALACIWSLILCLCVAVLGLVFPALLAFIFALVFSFAAYIEFKKTIKEKKEIDKP